MSLQDTFYWFVSQEEVAFKKNVEREMTTEQENSCKRLQSTYLLDPAISAGIPLPV